MRLNELKPAPGSKHARRRVGRGIGSGLGKTAGRGHKGQKARSGGYHKVGFEGGQMPLQRRLPKRGFASPTRDAIVEVRLSDLERMQTDTIDLAALRSAGLVPRLARGAKVIVSGKLTRKIAVNDEIGVSKGARAAIEAAGGSAPAAKPPPEAKKPAAPKQEAKGAAAGKGADQDAKGADQGAKGTKRDKGAKSGGDKGDKGAKSDAPGKGKKG